MNKSILPPSSTPARKPAARTPAPVKAAPAPVATSVPRLKDVPKHRPARVAKARAEREKAQLPKPAVEALAKKDSTREAIEDVAYAAEGLYDVKDVMGLTAGDAQRLARHAIYLANHDQDDAAFDCARVAAAVDPKNYDVCLVMAALLGRRKQYKEALVYYVELQKLAPNRVRTWVDSGEARIGLGQYAEAARDFGRALDLDPKTETPAGRRAAALIAKALMTVGGK